MTENNTTSAEDRDVILKPILKRTSGGQKKRVKRKPVGGSRSIAVISRGDSDNEAPRTSRTPKRVKFADRNRISFAGMDPNYVYRVVNDKDGRIQKMQGIGYEFVEDDENIGDYRVAEGSKMGSAVSKPVGNGVTGYLMKIRKEFYDEDQKAKAAKVDEIEKALKPSPVKGEYGPGVTNE